MDIYKLEKTSLNQIQEISFPLEKDIQTLIEENIPDVFGYIFVSSEFSVSEYRIDTLCFDEENNSFVVIEYKKGSSYSVIDQGYSYLSTMLNNKAEFILEYNEKTNTTLKRDEGNWSGSKVLFISPSFNSYQKNSVNFKDVPFELWEIKRFAGDLICLEQHKATSKQSIEKITGDNVIKSVSKEVRTYEEEDVVSKSEESIKQVWYQLKEKLINLDDSDITAQRNYIKYTKNRKGVCYFKFNRKGIRGGIIKGYIKPDGSKSRKFFEIDDPKNICRESHINKKSGDILHEIQFDIDTSTDLDYIEMLIKQKYKAI